MVWPYATSASERMGSSNCRWAGRPSETTIHSTRWIALHTAPSHWGGRMTGNWETSLLWRQFALNVTSQWSGSSILLSLGRRGVTRKRHHRTDPTAATPSRAPTPPRSAATAAPRATFSYVPPTGRETKSNKNGPNYSPRVQNDLPKLSTKTAPSTTNRSASTTQYPRPAVS